MRHSFPITLVLAAFIIASVCGKASAISPTPSTPPAKPPVVDTKRKVPAVQTFSTSTAATTVVKTKAKVPAAQNVSTSTAAVAVTKIKAPAAQAASTSGAAATTAPLAISTASNATAAQASSQIKSLTTANAATGTIAAGLPHGYIPQPVPDPQKDIAKQRQVIKQAEDDNAKLQQIRSDVLDLIRAVFDRSHFSQAFCESDGCFRYFSTDKFGGAGLFIKVRVDAKGHPLPEEFDRMVEAQKAAIDIVIANNNQLITNARTQIDFDKNEIAVDQIAKNGGALGGNGGDDLHRNGPIHQQ